jgi:hypothetical protein
MCTRKNGTKLKSRKQTQEKELKQVSRQQRIEEEKKPKCVIANAT